MSLAESCADLARWLPEAAALVACPDDDGYTGHGQPSSRPPGNTAAFNAVMDAVEGAARLEASLRIAVTGRPGRRRGGSDANTYAAIDAIGKLGHAVTEQDATTAARILDRWSWQIQQLPAIDEAEPWRRMQGVPCPYCEYPMLRVRPREGMVTCLRYGACPGDSDGHHPVGRLDVSRINGNPVIRWDDGLVT